MSKPITSQEALQREVNAVLELKRTLDDVFGDDPVLMADMIEGETDIEEAIIAVMETVDEDQLLVDGLEVRIPELQARKARLEKRIGTKKAAILQALTIAERETSIEAPTFTLSRKSTPQTAIVTDEAKIPGRFWKPKDPDLDKKELLSALKELKPGESIAGATLSNGGATLQIRRI